MLLSSASLLSLVLSDDIKFALNFVHPTVMWALFATTLYAAYLGFKWRTTRQMEAGEEKKALVKQRLNDKHHVIGSIVLAVMVIGNVGGLAVTYINNGKLFVGPHLLAGLGMTALIAASAALSPQMQKGKDWARSGHIALNTILVGLFGWQAVTGVQIVLRIINN
jgi:hypothetical protein